MSRIETIMPLNAIYELAARYKWITPSSTSVTPPRGHLWRLYGNILGRRYTITRKGKISTDEFIRTWKACHTTAKRNMAFGGMLIEVEEALRRLGTPFSVKVTGVLNVRKYVTLSINQAYTWQYNEEICAWEFAESNGVFNELSRQYMREILGVKRWTAKLDDTLTVQTHLMQQLSISE